MFMYTVFALNKDNTEASFDLEAKDGADALRKGQLAIKKDSKVKRVLRVCRN